MISDIRMLTNAEPFVPFSIHTADRGALQVPTANHAAVSPAGGSVVLFRDDDSHEILAASQISHLSIDCGTPTPSLNA